LKKKCSFFCFKNRRGRQALLQKKAGTAKKSRICQKKQDPWIIYAGAGKKSCRFLGDKKWFI